MITRAHGVITRAHGVIIREHTCAPSLWSTARAAAGGSLVITPLWARARQLWQRHGSIRSWPWSHSSAAAAGGGARTSAVFSPPDPAVPVAPAPEPPPSAAEPPPSAAVAPASARPAWPRHARSHDLARVRVRVRVRSRVGVSVGVRVGVMVSVRVRVRVSDQRLPCRLIVGRAVALQGES